jgi:hypothetical protein
MIVATLENNQTIQAEKSGSAWLITPDGLIILESVVYRPEVGNATQLACEAIAARVGSSIVSGVVEVDPSVGGRVY